MSHEVRELWRHRSPDAVQSVAIQHDGQHVVFATVKGAIECRRRDGSSRWVYTPEGGQAGPIALALGSHQVGVIYPQNVDVLDWDGQLIYREKSEATWTAGAFIPDLDGFCGGNNQGTIQTWTRTPGSAARPLWTFRAGRTPIRRVAVATTGDYIVVANEDGLLHLLCRGGSALWSHQATDRTWVATEISDECDAILMASKTHLTRLDRDGRVVWEQRLHGIVAATMSSNGLWTAAVTTGSDAPRRACTLQLYDEDGRLNRKVDFEFTVAWLDMSAGGRYVVLVAPDRVEILALETDHRVTYPQKPQSPSDTSVRTAFPTPDGAHCAAVEAGDEIVLYENLLDQDPAWRPLLVRRELNRSISRVRSFYAEEPILGLCTWFDEFDQHIRVGNLEVCGGLRNEIRDEGYPLSPIEKSYIDSREGVELLCKGIAHQLRGELDEAESCYHKSRSIQHKVRCLPAAGKTEYALLLLRKQRSSNAGDPDELRKVPLGLTALGGTASLLSERIAKASGAQIEVLIEAAFRLRLSEPLLDAVSGSPDLRARRLAAAALARFKKVDGPDKLRIALRDSQWLVRARAAKALSKSTPTPNIGHALCEALEAETDPAVRRELALAASRLGESRAASALMTYLDDRDPDVRIVAVEALGVLGGRPAIARLRTCPGGSDLKGNSIETCVQRAIAAIEKRLPLPKSVLFQTIRASTHEDASIFWFDEPILCASTVPDAALSARFKLRCTDGSEQIVFEQEGEMDKSPDRANSGHPVDPSIATAGRSSSSSSNATELVELRSAPSQAGKTARPAPGPRSILFRIPPLQVSPPELDMPISAQLLVATEDSDDFEQIATRDFTVIARVQLSQPRIHVALDNHNQPAHPATLILAGTPAVFCSASLSHAPSTLTMSAVMETPGAEGIPGVACVIPSQTDPRIVFKWSTTSWRPGEYLARLTPSRNGDAAEVRFRIIEQVLMHPPQTCFALDDGRRPIQPTVHFGPEARAIYCSAELDDCPPLTSVLAEWHYLDAPSTLIGWSIAMTDRGGGQCVGFSLQRSRSRLPIGRYKVRLAVLPPEVASRLVTRNPATDPGAALPSRTWKEREFAVASTRLAGESQVTDGAGDSTLKRS